MNRADILDAAKACVCGQRETDYGTPEDNFETIGLLWGTYLRAAHPRLQMVFGVNGDFGSAANALLKCHGSPKWGRWYERVKGGERA